MFIYEKSGKCMENGNSLTSKAYIYRCQNSHKRLCIYKINKKRLAAKNIY